MSKFKMLGNQNSLTQKINYFLIDCTSKNDHAQILNVPIIWQRTVLQLIYQHCNLLLNPRIYLMLGVLIGLLQYSYWFDFMKTST